MSILKREVLYGVNGSGNARFSNWAVVTTTLGTMVEPYFPNTLRGLGDSIPDYDPDDIMSKVTGFRQINIDKEMIELSGGTHSLNGGYLSPRLGR